MRKNIFILTFLMSIFAFSSCETDIEKVQVSSNPDAAVLAALPAFTAFTLDDVDNMLEFSWAAADFGFQSATTYTVQIDSVTKNFANPIEILVTATTGGAITVGEFNKKLINAGFEEYDVDYSLEARVVASISANVDDAVSNTVAFTVAPFATVFPPIYMTGAATGGWDWTKTVEMRSSAPNVYTTIAYFISGEAFRFFAQQDWGPTSYNYPHFAGGSVDALFEDALDGDNNLKFLGTTGYYEITTDLKNKTVVMTAVDEPKMFMTGAGVGGWDWTTNFVTMTWKSNGVFEATTAFVNAEAFRFFAQADWGPTSFNYPHFAGGTVTELLEDALDGDNNFKVLAASGSYKITINFLDNIITMEPSVK